MLLTAVGELAGHGVELWQLLAGLVDSRFEPALGNAHFIMAAGISMYSWGLVQVLTRGDVRVSGDKGRGNFETGQTLAPHLLSLPETMLRLTVLRLLPDTSRWFASTLELCCAT